MDSITNTNDFTSDELVVLFMAAAWFLDEIKETNGVIFPNGRVKAAGREALTSVRSKLRRQIQEMHA